VALRRSFGEETVYILGKVQGLEKYQWRTYSYIVYLVEDLHRFFGGGPVPLIWWSACTTLQGTG
jgi:hypothetical protein